MERDLYFRDRSGTLEAVVGLPKAALKRPHCSRRFATTETKGIFKSRIRGGKAVGGYRTPRRSALDEQKSICERWPIG